jgi:phytoene synthase
MFRNAMLILPRDVAGSLGIEPGKLQACEPGMKAWPDTARVGVVHGQYLSGQLVVRGVAGSSDNFAQLDRYCECVAVAVGRLSVRIFGEQTPAGERVAAELGRALQLTNILRDLAEDSARHRLYLPRELLRAHGIFGTIPSWVLAHPALPDVCRDLAMLAERYYHAAAAAIAACPRHTMRPAAVTLAVSRALLCGLLERGWRRLDEPVRIPASGKPALLLLHGLAGR